MPIIYTSLSASLSPARPLRPLWSSAGSRTVNRSRSSLRCRKPESSSATGLKVIFLSSTPALLPPSRWPKAKATSWFEKETGTKATARWPAHAVCRSDQLHGRRVLRVAVVVKAAPALSAIKPRQHHALQQERRRETLLFKLVEHDVGDVVGRIESDEIEQRERPHRI